MRRYGRWVPEDETRCIAVTGVSLIWGTSQCQRRRGHGPDGLYCKQHAKIIEQGRDVSVPEETCEQGGRT